MQSSVARGKFYGSNLKYSTVLSSHLRRIPYNMDHHFLVSTDAKLLVQFINVLHSLQQILKYPHLKNDHEWRLRTASQGRRERVRAPVKIFFGSPINGKQARNFQAKSERPTLRCSDFGLVGKGQFLQPTYNDTTGKDTNTCTTHRASVGTR